jgi:hypothetical protein
MNTENKPIAAGRCLLNVEAMSAHLRDGRISHAGIRVMQPSSGGDDCHYAPPSDVYLYCNAKDAQELSAFFSNIARKLQGVDA